MNLPQEHQGEQADYANAATDDDDDGLRSDKLL